MKSFKDRQDVIEEASKTSLPKTSQDPPAVLIMRRKSIRQFGNGQKVAIYHVDKLDKYITVPYGGMTWTVEEVEPESKTDGVLEEHVMDHLTDIVKNKQAKKVKFQDGSTMRVDATTANAILKVHGALNHENKQKVSDMVHKGKSHFMKVADFAMKHTKFKIG
jgi:hypothetical protein